MRTLRWSLALAYIVVVVLGQQQQGDDVPLRVTGVEYPRDEADTQIENPTKSRRYPERTYRYNTNPENQDSGNPAADPDDPPIARQGNYLLPWQNASLQNYPGPSGGSNQYPAQFPGASNQYPGQYPGASNPYAGPSDRRGNNNQPGRLPALPDPGPDIRDQDPGDLFRQFAEQRDQQEGVVSSNSNNNDNIANNNANSNAGANSRSSNSRNSNSNVSANSTITVSGTTRRTTSRPGQPTTTTRDPFQDPNRYRIPQAQDSVGVRFVNGLPYRESVNVKDQYGNRYDPRFHAIPGEYDPENDPRFSDPRYQDPRNLPKYDSNRQNVPKDRYDSKYRYYERFPDRQRDRLRDPNYDPRWDPDEPRAPGVLGGWLPELQGECRPGCENLDRDVTVNTNYGRVNGFYVYLYDGPRTPLYSRPGYAHTDKVKFKVSVFLGIPYAMPPVGEARLMPPRPHRGWQSYDAVDWAPVCPQPIKYVGATKNAPLMDEDCLYLNIFTPTVESTVAQLFPVMIYIHGGEFQKGSANEFPGHQLAANGQVVVVAMNYRLGALGFLSTGDHHAPGNYGLLDMAMAIKWVYDNVYAFQGDRDKITLFGPDAGACAAGILAVMPKTRHMVRRVIAISGSPLADWAVFNDKFRAMNTSLVFGERIGCTIESSWKLVDCVKRGRSIQELAHIEFKPEIGTWPWAPVVQKNISVPEDTWHPEWNSDDFMAIPELISVLYENQMYHPKFQYLTGVSRDDASYMLYANKTIAPNFDIGWDFFDIMVRDHINQYNYTLNPIGIFNAIKYMYTYYPDPNNRSHIREEFVNFWSDYFFVAPQDAIVKTLVRNRVDTYMYVQNTTVEALKLPWWRRITHNLEHYFLTGAPFMDMVYFPEHEQVSRVLWTEGDRNMSEFFIYAFANFSWYGNPTPKNILGVHWDMTVPGEIQKFLAVNTTENSTTLWNYRQRECAFWMEYLPSVIGYITPTYPPTTEFWWEPESPLQIAFWSMSSVCLFLLVLVVVCCLLWRNARRNAKDRYYDAQSLKNFPTDFDHLVGDHYTKLGKDSVIGSTPHSPALSTKTARTQMDAGSAAAATSPGGLSHAPSVHSLGVLGLRPVPPPLPGHGLPAVPGQQQPPSLASGQLVSLTPSLLPKGSLPPTPALSQKGIAVGPGEIPNGAGPFANAGMLHNTSDDSILTNQSGGGIFMNGSGRGSAHASRLILQQQPQPSLETLGGSRYTEPYAAANRFAAAEPQPMGLPRVNSAAGQAKLTPGRMTQPAAGPGPHQQQQQQQPSRPQSRASGRGAGRGVVPFTAV